MKLRYLQVVLTLAAWSCAWTGVHAATEALEWNMAGQKKITCIYGEITPLASVPGIYFCGAQWDGVVGYCGIQHNSDTERRTIFSIWDTSPTQHPRVTKSLSTNKIPACCQGF